MAKYLDRSAAASSPAGSARLARRAGDGSYRQRSIGRVIAAAAGLALLGSLEVRADHRWLTLDPAATRVAFTVPATGHDVEGSFGTVTGRIDLDRDSGAAVGSVTVDLVAAATGNASRDKTLRQKVLETDRFGLATLTAERLVGNVPDEGTADVTLIGSLELHGAAHQVEMPAHLRVHDGRLELTATLAVPFKAWGLKDPSLMFLRVADVVAVTITGSGRFDANGVGSADRGASGATVNAAAGSANLGATNVP